MGIPCGVERDTFYYQIIQIENGYIYRRRVSFGLFNSRGNSITFLREPETFGFDHEMKYEQIQSIFLNSETKPFAVPSATVTSP